MKQSVTSSLDADYYFINANRLIEGMVKGHIKIIKHTLLINGGNIDFSIDH